MMQESQRLISITPHRCTREIVVDLFDIAAQRYRLWHDKKGGQKLRRDNSATDRLEPNGYAAETEETPDLTWTYTASNQTSQRGTCRSKRRQISSGFETS